MTDRAESVERDHHTSGDFLGEFDGLKIRVTPNGTMLEIHGDGGVAAIEITDERVVDGLTEAAAEIQLALDELEHSP